MAGVTSAGTMRRASSRPSVMSSASAARSPVTSASLAGRTLSRSPRSASRTASSPAANADHTSGMQLGRAMGASRVPQYEALLELADDDPVQLEVLDLGSLVLGSEP